MILKLRESNINWGEIQIREEIDALFSELAGCIDRRPEEKGGEAQGQRIHAANPMTLWFPNGYDREVYLANHRKILEDGKVWRGENREYLRAHKRKYYQMNKPIYRARTAKRRDADREGYRAYCRTYYQKNKERILAYKNAWRAARKAAANP